MTKTITVDVDFPSVKEAGKAQATALAMRDNFEKGTPQYKFWESLHFELFHVYENMWERRYG